MLISGWLLSSCHGLDFQTLSLVDPTGSKGRRDVSTRVPQVPKRYFFNFHPVLGKNNRLAPPPWDLAPHIWEILDPPLPVMVREWKAVSTQDTVSKVLRLCWDDSIYQEPYWLHFCTTSFLLLDPMKIRYFAPVTIAFPMKTQHHQHNPRDWHFAGCNTGLHYERPPTGCNKWHLQWFKHYPSCWYWLAGCNACI